MQPLFDAVTHYSEGVPAYIFIHNSLKQTNCIATSFYCFYVVIADKR